MMKISGPESQIYQVIGSNLRRCVDQKNCKIIGMRNFLKEVTNKGFTRSSYPKFLRSNITPLVEKVKNRWKKFKCSGGKRLQVRLLSGWLILCSLILLRVACFVEFWDSKITKLGSLDSDEDHRFNLLIV